MRYFLLSLLFVSSAHAQTKHNNDLIGQPKKRLLPKFISVPFFGKRISEQTRYADIMNHCNGLNQPVFGYSRPTNAHETTAR